MTTQHKLKLGVLVSGSGSNLQSIIDACSTGKISAEVVIVISDNPEAYALTRAANAHIRSCVVERSNFQKRSDFEEHIVSELKKAGVELICLAGFMRIVGKTLLHAFPERVINIHPALLPSFPGLDAQKQAHDHGVKVAGCTVHFVDEKIDHGPIIAQSALNVSEGESCEELKNRILDLEHELYPQVVSLIAENRVKISNHRVYISPKKS